MPHHLSSADLAIHSACIWSCCTWRFHLRRFAYVSRRPAGFSRGCKIGGRHVKTLCGDSDEASNRRTLPPSETGHNPSYLRRSAIYRANRLWAIDITYIRWHVLRPISPCARRSAACGFHVPLSLKKLFHHAACVLRRYAGVHARHGTPEILPPTRQPFHRGGSPASSPARHRGSAWLQGRLRETTCSSSSNGADVNTRNVYLLASLRNRRRGERFDRPVSRTSTTGRSPIRALTDRTPNQSLLQPSLLSPRGVLIPARAPLIVRGGSCSIKAGPAISRRPLSPSMADCRLQYHHQPPYHPPPPPPLPPSSRPARLSATLSRLPER